MVSAEVTELTRGYAVARQIDTTEEGLMHTIFPHPNPARDDARGRA
jgi:dihydrolipoamide dehydrogenase